MCTSQPLRHSRRNPSRFSPRAQRSCQRPLNIFIVHSQPQEQSLHQLRYYPGSCCNVLPMAATSRLSSRCYYRDKSLTCSRLGKFMSTSHQRNHLSKPLWRWTWAHSSARRRTFTFVIRGTCMAGEVDPRSSILHPLTFFPLLAWQ